MANEELEITTGCGYEGREFGAEYPDAVCLDGWLWDKDSGEQVDGGVAYSSGGDTPCPRCNPKTPTLPRVIVHRDFEGAHGGAVCWCNPVIDSGIRSAREVAAETEGLEN